MLPTHIGGFTGYRVGTATSLASSILRKHASHFSPIFRSTFFPSSVLFHTASRIGPLPSARSVSVSTLSNKGNALRWAFIHSARSFTSVMVYTTPPGRNTYAYSAKRVGEMMRALCLRSLKCGSGKRKKSAGQGMFRKVIRQKLHGVRADNGHVLIPTGGSCRTRFSGGRLRWWWCRRGSTECSDPILDILRDLYADFETSRNGNASRFKARTKRKGREIFCIRTQHERVRIKGSQGDKQAAKPASYIRKLGFLSRPSK